MVLKLSNNKVLSFDNNDIKTFEKLYNQKALNRKKKPTKTFITYLTKDDSHFLKKTVVKLEQEDTTGKIINKSYEKELNHSDFEKEISELIKKVQYIDLTEIERENIQNVIKQLLKDNSKDKIFSMNTNVESNDINAQDLLVDTSENYLGFVYFFLHLQQTFLQVDNC